MRSPRGSCGPSRRRALADVPVDELRQRQIKEAWRALRPDGRAAGAVKRYQSVLSGALAYAVAELEVIPANPALGMRGDAQPVEPIRLAS